MTNQEKILVIKLSALGDFVQNFGIMRAIRAHHPTAYISILTTAPYQDLAKSSGYFDEVLIDPRPKFYQLKKWLHLKHTLNRKNFSTIYDLQINDRTALYYSLFKTKIIYHFNSLILKRAIIFSLFVSLFFLLVSI